MAQQRVVVLGATPKEDRYANMAMRELRTHGHTAIPVNPAFPEVLGEPCFKSIADVPQPIDTVTMYVNERRSDLVVDEILAAAPKRIIFNPGAENEKLADQAAERGIEAVFGCTLVMLQTGTF